jgi:hypothetical protein
MLTSSQLKRKPSHFKTVIAFGLAPAVLLFLAYLGLLSMESNKDAQVVSISECAAVGEPMNRLACYDAIAKGPNGSASGAAQ